MGTHPIFESDFDCLTDVKMEAHYSQIYLIQSVLEKLSDYVQNNKPFVRLDNAELGATLLELSNGVLTLADHFSGFTEHFGIGQIRTYRAKHGAVGEGSDDNQEQEEMDNDLKRALELSMMTSLQDDARRLEKDRMKVDKKKPELAKVIVLDSDDEVEVKMEEKPQVKREKPQ